MGRPTMPVAETTDSDGVWAYSGTHQVGIYWEEKVR